MHKIYRTSMTSWCHYTSRYVKSRDHKITRGHVTYTSRHHATSRGHRDVTVCTWWRQWEHFKTLKTSYDHCDVISVTSSLRLHATDTKDLTVGPINATHAIITDVSWFRWETRSTEPYQNQKSHTGADESITISYNLFLVNRDKNVLSDNLDLYFRKMKPPGAQAVLRSLGSWNVRSESREMLSPLHASS